MPISDLLLTGVNLMFVGMGIVFVFLVVLVFTMLGMSKIAMRFEPERQDDHAGLANPPSSATQQIGLRGDLVAAISVAVSRYRAKHR